MQELTLEATREHLGDALAFLEAKLEEMDCPLRAQMQISVAADELLSNIVNYAYPDKTGTFTLRVEAADDPPGAVLTFSDEGIPYDPLSQAEPDVSLPAEERAIGGLGIFLVRKTMDEVAYRYEDGKNILRIRKDF